MTAHLHETGTGTGTGEDGVNTLQAWRTGIDTHQEPVVYMRRDCPVCRSEGFTTQARVQLTAGRRSIVATLSVVDGDWLAENVAGLSESAWASLGAQPGQLVTVTHAPPLDSLSHVRAKVYGNALGDAEFSAIISDVAAGHYSDLHLATFITACAGDRLDLAETVSLTKAMIGVGDRIDWGRPLVVDKHCVGGLPGNRTTLLVVPIVAACGLTMPKTSSRAITSPAGTADTMEVLARDLKAMGLYASRSLSFEGVEYEILEHALTEEQVRIYDSYAEAYQVIHNRLDQALEACSITSATGTLNKNAKAAARSAFESAKQRFFGHLLTSMKTPTLIRQTTEDLEAGHAAVTGHERIVINSQDRSMGEAIVRGANAILTERGLPAGLTLSDESGDFSGGLKLREGSVEVNCTVDTLLALSRNSLDAEIAAILFD